MPRSLAIDSALTALIESSVRPPSAPSTTAIASGPVSRSPMRPWHSISILSTEPQAASEVASLPSCRHSGRKGLSSSRSSAEIDGALTAVVTLPPCRAATTCSAAW